MKVYLDHNATTPVHPKVKEAMIQAIDIYGNPSSSYTLGRQSHYLIEESRSKTAQFLGIESKQLIFTASGSEANNMVLKGLLPNSSIINEKNHLIISSIEHPSVMTCAESLRARGIDLTFLSVDSYGRVDLEELKTAIQPNTRLVSIMLANNEIGTIQPVKEAVKIAHERNIPFHTDAIQAIGKIPVDIKDLGVDYLTLSGHKFYGPKGVGVLYARKPKKLHPIIEGGPHELGLRAGTENTLAIIGLGVAIDCLKQEMDESNQRLIRLRKRLEEGILKTIPNTSLNGHHDQRLPGTVNISFNDVEGKAILLNLDMEGISVSTGSACSSHLSEPSYVIQALGYSYERAYSSVRFSLGWGNTDEQMDYVLNKLPQVVTDLRRLT